MIDVIRIDAWLDADPSGVLEGATILGRLEIKPAAGGRYAGFRIRGRDGVEYAAYYERTGDHFKVAVLDPNHLQES